jgi:hypothetical protein
MNGSVIPDLEFSSLGLVCEELESPVPDPTSCHALSSRRDRSVAHSAPEWQSWEERTQKSSL